jgi:hypothetical protein
LFLRERFGRFEFEGRFDCDWRWAEAWTSRKLTLRVSAPLSMALGEWAATMCIARENGIFALQMGQSLKSDWGARSFTLIKNISTAPENSKQFGHF